MGGTNFSLLVSAARYLSQTRVRIQIMGQGFVNAPSESTDILYIVLSRARITSAGGYSVSVFKFDQNSPRELYILSEKLQH